MRNIFRLPPYLPGSTVSCSINCNWTGKKSIVVLWVTRATSSYQWIRDTCETYNTDIAVIGPTAHLGAPTAAELAKTFEVRAIVRSLDKGKSMLPSNRDIV
ncbi:Nucleoside-diphosphate-sugar epimerase [Lachancea thermotolerans]